MRTKSEHQDKSTDCFFLSLLPEEFVAAGDFLTYKFPTWTWSPASSSDAKYTRDFLPSDKQYLISRGVPCLRRVSQMEKAALGSSSKAGQSNTGETDERLLNFGEGHDGEEVAGKGTEEDWLATHLDDDPSHTAVAGDIADMPDSEPPMASLTPGEEDELASRVAGTHLAGPQGGISGTGKGDDDVNTGAEIGDIPDMDDEDDELGGLGEGVVEADDPATANVHRGTTSQQGTVDAAKGSKLISVRTYDCLITYDKYYQTPRMWLVGYNESGQPLKPAEIFEDVSSDYAQKTVTVEPFPHGNLSTASIHPCKHASVMKKVIERMNASVIEEQKKASNSASGDSATKKKKGWGLGGAMKKISGSKDSAGGTPESGVQTPSANTGNTDSLANTAGGDEEGQTTEVEGLRVDQYLLIFLKFMASIVPAIEIDATQAV